MAWPLAYRGRFGALDGTRTRGLLLDRELPLPLGHESA